MVRVDIVEDVKIAKVTFKNVHNTVFQLRSRIQLTQKGFKLIKFGNNKRKQIEQQVGYEDIMVDIANILAVEDNNCLLFKNNIEYLWAKFIQVSKMTKKSIAMFFNNSDFGTYAGHLSYKNVDKMRAL